MTLEVQDLVFDYGEKRLLRGVSFSVNSGSMLHIRGANGSGKTTLLKLISGILSPLQGKVRFQGQLITDDRVHFQKQICMLGHKSGVSQLLTVREQCHYELHRESTSPSVDACLKQFGLWEMADVPCSLLSVGLRRRVGLIRFLMTSAPVWLLDEPIAALDQGAVKLMVSCFLKQLERGGLIVLTSHQSIPLSAHYYQEYCLK